MLGEPKDGDDGNKEGEVFSSSVPDEAVPDEYIVLLKNGDGLEKHF